MTTLVHVSVLVYIGIEINKDPQQAVTTLVIAMC